MLLVVLALAVVPPLAAQAPAPGGEDVRRGLIDFVTELEGLPGFDPARIAAVRDRIASLDPQELELVARRANAVPRWQRVPEVLHSLVELQEKQQRELVASYLKRRMPAGKEDPTAELERFR
ncbi:MAG: hypothetical protein GY856_22565, partial [bacterium]|nr:hypothetical protein [bacterium]